MVDDAFWLKYAKDHTEKATDLVNSGADKLDSFLTWAWGIYTTVFTAAIILNQVSDSASSRIIMALPVIIIPIAKFLCIRVQLPVFAKYFPDIPDSIVQDLYSAVINKKHKLFNWAIGIAILGILNIALSLFIFKTESGSDFKIQVAHLDNIHSLSISAQITKSKTAIITVLGKVQDTAFRSIDFKIKSDKEGRIDTLINDKGLTTIIKAYCKWDIDSENSKIIDNQ